jgi:tol-pal system protein YbgF
VLAEVKNAHEAQAQELTRLAGEVKALDAQQAFLVAELKNLGDQLAKLKASADDTESALRSLRATPVPPELREAAAPAPPPSQAIESTPVPAPKSSGTAAAAPAAPATAVTSRNTEADRVFSAALAKLRAGDVAQAAREFSDFVARFPNDPQAPTAQNQIGEVYYRQREYRQAWDEFQKTVDGYTQAAQVSEALLKIGLCQRALGDTARAKASWEQVLKQFPKSDAARQARTLLAASSAPRQ